MHYGWRSNVDSPRHEEEKQDCRDGRGRRLISEHDDDETESIGQVSLYGGHRGGRSYEASPQGLALEALGEASVDHK